MKIERKEKFFISDTRNTRNSNDKETIISKALILNASLFYYTVGRLMHYFYKIVLKSYEEGFEFFNLQIASKGTRIPVNSQRNTAETTR